MSFNGFVTPIFVICRDKVSQLAQLVEWLERGGYTNLILVDNASTYPPLVSYLERSPHAVVRHSENLGPHKAVWGSGVLARYASSKYYVVTDSDVLPDDECPTDAVDYFHYVLQRYPGYSKAGFSLRIDNLPDCYSLKAQVREWEQPFWWRRLERNLYHAVIDTTFALYRPDSVFSYGPGVRTGKPYWARHLPWYGDLDNPTDEERYYRCHAEAGVAHWDLSGQREWAPTPNMTLRERLSWPLHSAIKVKRNRAAKWRPGALPA